MRGTILAALHEFALWLADDGIRTHMPGKAADLKSAVYASSTTSANFGVPDRARTCNANVYETLAQSI